MKKRIWLFKDCYNAVAGQHAVIGKIAMAILLAALLAIVGISAFVLNAVSTLGFNFLRRFNKDNFEQAPRKPYQVKGDDG